MRKKYKIFRFNNSLKHLLMLPLMLLFLSACSSDDGGGGGVGVCDTVANPDGPAFFKVENNLDSGLMWILEVYAFGADMKPGECTIMGVDPDQYTVEIQQCNIGDAACTSTIGSSKLIVFSVGQGETYALTVDSNTF